MDFARLKQQAGLIMREEFHERHIYFPEDGVSPLLQAVLKAR
jgi:hypothetical protein